MPKLKFARGFAAVAVAFALLAAGFSGGASAGAAPVTAAVYDTTTGSSLTVVVNKKHPLTPLTYKPAKFGSNNLAKPASDAFDLMRVAMAKAGAGDLVLASGYRGYYEQKAIFNRNVARWGKAKAFALTAKPGFSEHQTGLAADLSASGQGCRLFACFASTKAGKWLASNSWRYGFILRYPNGATKITGYDFEPWHYRFVGKPLAGAMHNAKAAVLETYLGLPAAPTY